MPTKSSTDKGSVVTSAARQPEGTAFPPGARAQRDGSTWIFGPGPAPAGRCPRGHLGRVGRVDDGVESEVRQGRPGPHSLDAGHRLIGLTEQVDPHATV